MTDILRHLLPSPLVAARDTRRDIAAWRREKFSAPSPVAAKREVLKRYGIAQSTWVETGTYLGDTTALLAESSPHVITLEPAVSLYLKAKERFKNSPHVTVMNTASETVFPRLLSTLSGDVSFWLDGHYSGGDTFQGQTDSPLRAELEQIKLCLPKYTNIAVLIDDIRFCGPQAGSEYSGYPTLDELVDWSRANGLKWLIEHDIFIARRHF